jgi:hypothetical protein
MSITRLILIILIIPITGTFAQEDLSSFHQLRKILKEKQYETAEYRETELEKIKGTPYLSDQYLPSLVYFKENKKPYRAKLKYNAHSDNFEFVQAGNLFVISNVEEIDSIKYMNQNFIYTTYIKKESGLFGSSEKKIEGFLAELVAGTCSLYKIYSVEFYEEDPPDTGYEKYEPARFEKKDPRYCLQCVNDSHPQVINSFRKGKFLEQFNASEKTLKKYIDNNDIQLRKEDDLMQFIRYYNQHHAGN